MGDLMIGAKRAVVHPSPPESPNHITVASKGLQRPELVVARTQRPEVRGPLGMNPSAPGFVGFIYQTITFFSFDWISWGNGKSEDLKEQTIQEVSNFAILSALAMSLGLSCVLVVDGNDSWSGAPLEGIGLAFATSNTSFIMALLTSAFLLLVINEAPAGRVCRDLIDGLGGWLKVPGMCFSMGIYGYAAVLFVFQLHNFNLIITATNLTISTAFATFVIFGAVMPSIGLLHKALSSYGYLIIRNDQEARQALKYWLHTKCKGEVELYKRADFQEWILDEYDAHEFGELSKKRLDKILDKWEEDAMHGQGLSVLELLPPAEAS